MSFERRWVCQECARDRTEGSVGGFGGSDSEIEKPPPPTDEPLSQQDTTNVADIAQSIDNEKFLAKHGCECRSGGTATLYYPADNVFRCFDCANYYNKPFAVPVDEDSKGSATQPDPTGEGRIDEGDQIAMEISKRKRIFK